MLEASTGYFINPLVNIFTGDDFSWRTLPSNAVAGGDSGGVRRAGATLDVWFTADYRAGAGVWFAFLRRVRKKIAVEAQTGMLVRNAMAVAGRRDLSVWHRR